MDEGRKRVLLIAAAILAARKLANWDGRPSPAFECALTDAITVAERILSRIDTRWPQEPDANQDDSQMLTGVEPVMMEGLAGVAPATCRVLKYI